MELVRTKTLRNSDLLLTENYNNLKNIVSSVRKRRESRSKPGASVASSNSRISPGTRRKGIIFQFVAGFPRCDGVIFTRKPAPGLH